MFSSLQMNNPVALWLLLLVLPIGYFSVVYLAGTERVRRWVISTVRVGLLLLLVALLCDLRKVERNDRLTVIGVIDTSGSVRQFADLPIEAHAEVLRDNLDFLRNWFRRATANKRPDDRVGLVIFDGKPLALATPTTGTVDDSGIDQEQFEGTNIADALRYGMALFPPDTARRLVLLTDGNETTGDALAAVRELGGGGGGGIPIDLVPIEYAVAREVLVERVEVPTFGRPDQRVTVRILLRSTTAVVGRVQLKMEDEFVDLNGAEREGTSRVVQLSPGLNVVTAEVVLGQAAVSRFEATFETLENTGDTMQGNNIAEAFVISPQRGSVLIADGVYDGRGYFLGAVLEEAGLSVKVVPAVGLPTSLVELQAYDLVILQNVAREDVAEEVQQHLVRYVNDLGGGLLMVGGYDSFGAGHWEETAVAELLPVSLAVPEEMQIPTAAIALILDRSGSMNYPVTGTRRTKQEIANEGAAVAIEALDRHDYVAVYSFSYTTNTVVPMQLAENPQQIADKVRTIRAGGGTNIRPALERAFADLRNVDAEIKHVVCLSDGQSEGSGFGELAAQMNAAGITVSAIAVGNDADEAAMELIATAGGGRYYFVRNPAILPRIFVKEIRVLRRPLIREFDFQPILRPTSSGVLAGLDSAGPLPPLHGLVLTRPLEDDATVHLLMLTPAGEPLLAYKQQGLGRTGAFTSDAHDLWARDWLNWPGYRQLWVQLARTVGRPPGNRDYELQTAFENDRLMVRLLDSREGAGRTVPEIADAANEVNRTGISFPLVVPGYVYTPDGQALPIRLRQTGPGFYEAGVSGAVGGNYVVALTPQRGGNQLGLVLGGASRPTGIEFRALQSDTSRLEAQVRAVGGRVLDLNAPEVRDLFDPATIPETLSLVPLWPKLLWWALGLLLFDVGLRRIAWDGALIRQRIQETLARIHRAPQHAEAAAARLQELRDKGLSIASAGPARFSAAATAEEDARANADAGQSPLRQKIRLGNEDLPVEKAGNHSKKMEPAEAANEQLVTAARLKGLAALRGTPSRVVTSGDAAPGDMPSKGGQTKGSKSAAIGESACPTGEDRGTDTPEVANAASAEAGSAVGQLAARRRALRNPPTEEELRAGNTDAATE